MAHSPSSSPAPGLVLFTRQGCCLCEGLEEKLRDLGLSASGPATALMLVDVDADPQLQARYGLEVPVLALREGGSLRELPRVPPRLMGERLAAWLENAGVRIAAEPAG